MVSFPLRSLCFLWNCPLFSFHGGLDGSKNQFEHGNEDRSPLPRFKLWSSKPIFLHVCNSYKLCNQLTSPDSTDFSISFPDLESPFPFAASFSGHLLPSVNTWKRSCDAWVIKSLVVPNAVERTKIECLLPCLTYYNVGLLSLNEVVLL